VSTAPKQTKAQRQAEQRAAQLEAFKKRQVAEKRTRVLTIALSILAAVAVVAIVAVVIVINNQP
jgi:type IV secretory pathway component VirB8